jgi:carbon-monoxide dehydrogenase large subunit
MKFGMGQSVRRTEDLRLVTGHGNYTDDVDLPGQTFAVFARSPHAHAKLLSVDVSAAREAPGVIAVLTFDEIEAMGAGRLTCLAPLKSRDGSMFKGSEQPFLAQGKVRFVGEAVAMVIAETAEHAKDAAELVMADYEPLEAVGTLEAVEAMAIAIAKEIRSQYIIAYNPTKPDDGVFRQVRIAVKAPGNPTVRTRSGYYATAAGTKISAVL